MPVKLTEIQLDTMELLSLVDKGASGDPENRPEIVLFKRKKQSTMLERIMQILKRSPEDHQPGSQVEPLAKGSQMELGQIVAAIDELGLSDEQKAGVLKLLESAMAGPKPPEAPPAEDLSAAAPPPAAPEDEEQKPMAKRDEPEVDQEKVELAKRVQDLEDQIELTKLEKQADAYAFLPAPREQIVSMLKRNAGDKDFLEMLSKLNKASEESPILKKYGDKGAGEETPLSKREKLIEQERRDLRKAGKQDTYAIAYRNVVERNPELHRIEEDQ